MKLLQLLFLPLALLPFYKLISDKAEIDNVTPTNYESDTPALDENQEFFEINNNLIPQDYNHGSSYYEVTRCYSDVKPCDINAEECAGLSVQMEKLKIRVSPFGLSIESRCLTTEDNSECTIPTPHYPSGNIMVHDLPSYPQVEKILYQLYDKLSKDEKEAGHTRSKEQLSLFNLFRLSAAYNNKKIQSVDDCKEIKQSLYKKPLL